MSLSFEMRVAAVPDVLISAVEGEAVLLNLNTESYFGLDEVGTSMWKTLTTSDSIQAAYDSLLSAYDVEPEQLRRDLEAFVRELAEHGLVAVNEK